MKFCYKTNSTLPKQCQSSRSVLEDGSRTFGLFWKEKTPSYNRRNTVLLKAGIVVKIIDVQALCQFVPYCSLSCRSKLIGCQIQDNFGTFC